MTATLIDIRKLTAKITPCDGTATSSRWCCGETRGCCDSNSGVVLLEQVLGQVSSSVISSSSSATSPPRASTSVDTSASALPPATSSADSGSKGLSGGAIAGIVIGAIGGLALFLLGFFLAMRRRSRKNSETTYGDPTVAEVPYSPAAEVQELGHSVKYAHVQEMPEAPPGELQGDMPLQAHRP